MSFEPTIVQSLKRSKCGDFVYFEDEATMSCSRDWSVHRVLKLFASCKITSIPVVDDVNTPIAVLTLEDIVRHVAMLASIRFDPRTTDDVMAELRALTVGEFLDKECGITDRLVIMDAEESLLSATERLAAGIHRICVVSNSELVTMITQTALLRFMVQSMHILHLRGFNMTMAEFVPRWVGDRVVVEAAPDVKTIDVINLMAKTGASGVAIVDTSADPEGVLIAQISRSDLRALLYVPEGVDLLHKDVITFYKVANTVESNIKYPRIGVTLDDTLSKAIEKMVATRLHHIYVLDSGFRSPRSVVCVHDVLSMAVADVETFGVQPE
ncbi:CBS domain [Carpediemonas membranifera]|uniref:CBS domain n=1 Tax=Carpediemonas membranifera TaxID=201153 RepID=A0A8J6AXT8_9EUKA|nr:CBS domain [Carpediemonas membranifera]|eukprot:KAG9391053.1 CBS domain [Carpediemonas membranifera]